MTTIKDGTGGGHLVRVTDNNRLAVTSESLSALAVASADRSDAYTATTGTAQIFCANAAGESGVLWIQNASQTQLALSGIYASASANGIWRIYRNPTSGTLLSGGTVVSPTNLNFASAKKFDGEVRYGASGTTATGGTIVALGLVLPGFRILPLEGGLVLSASNSMALTFEPAGTDSSVTATAVLSYVGE